MADQSYNAAWRMAEQMKSRARATERPGTLKMLGAWMVFAFMLMMGTLLALFFVLLGWAMMPLIRHRMKKRAERQGQTFDGESARSGNHPHQVLEGEFEVRRSAHG
ncbi:hypothetical protein [Kushneria aurantia]|uniref:DUF3742 family protein n=1 Tax=Kushneria aurantia TaxID=504092 RepID=A0ABV6G615_9GAMM|nr:hypothetical protein [Kushneria aurantia]